MRAAQLTHIGINQLARTRRHSVQLLRRRSDGNWQGWTLVQRIEPARLTRSGTQVRITLQASSAAGATGASIDRIYISQPSSAPGAHPYDSAADLAKIYDGMDAGVPLVRAVGDSTPVPKVDQT
jgi:hypothetical protein